MKEKNIKIIKGVLYPIAGLLILGSGLAIGMSIMSKKSVEERILAGDTDVKIYGDEIYTYWKFTLLAPLGSNQEIVTDLVDDTYYSFSSSEEGLTVKDRLVQIPVIRNTNNVTGFKQSIYNIKFTCRDKTTKSEIWTKNINDCKVSYEPMIDIEDETDKTVFALSNDGKTMTFTYQFRLMSELGKLGETELKLKPYVLNSIDLYQNDEILVVPDAVIDPVDTTKVTLTLTCTTTESSAIPEGKSIQPIIQFECTYKESSWWQSNIFKKLKCSYGFTEVETTLADLDYELESTNHGNAPSYVLKGLKTTVAADVNTLVIPASSKGTWIRVVGNNGNVLSNISNIRKVKFEGISVQEVEANAFKDCNKITCLDLTGIPDSVKRIDMIDFGDSSFSGLASKGKIIWASDMSLYKKHIVKEKLYHAGLTGPDWFGIIEVTNESKLREAAATGGYIKLMNDINLTSTIAQGAYTGQLNFLTSSILDLNGKTLYCDKPIYNIDAAEYAIIGVWDCEVVVTDTSDNHNGSIKAFDYVQNGYTKPEDTDLPKETGVENETIQWAWDEANNRFKPRETRCFYVRSDIPTKTKGTLEILAGNYYGNCTCVFNWNTVCYIEDYFPNAAPEFHIQTASFGVTPHKAISNPSIELLNCKEDTFENGTAYFDVYGGKFFGYDTSTCAKVGEEYQRTINGHQLYDPFESKGDNVLNPDTGKQVYPNFVDGHKIFLEKGKYVERGWYKPTGWTPDDGYKGAKEIIGTGDNQYELVTYTKQTI